MYIQYLYTLFLQGPYMNSIDNIHAVFLKQKRFELKLLYFRVIRRCNNHTTSVMLPLFQFRVLNLEEVSDHWSAVIETAHVHTPLTP